MSRLIDADKLKEGVSSYHFKNLIDDQPTVEAEPIRHGQWNKENEEDTLFRLCVYKCSLCGGSALSEVHLFKYCPYCGASMDEVEE